MMKNKKIFMSAALALSLFGSGLNVSAAPQKQSFESWLEDYGAWDILSDSYSQHDESPELIMKRANTSYLLGRYSDAMKILQSTPSFNDNSTEVKRLWLGGQVLRSFGKPDQSFIWFSQAAKLMDNQKLKKQFEKETEFKSYWFDVWRNMFWSYLVTPAPASEARRMILDQAIEQASIVWPTTYFVLNVSQQWHNGDVNSTAPEIISGNATMVSDNDRILISKSLAAASLGSIENSKEIISELSDDLVKTFWQGVLTFAETGKTTRELNKFKDNGLIHPWAFLASGTLSSAIGSDNIWKLPDPSSPAWAAFREKLMKMDPNEALSTIDRETGSLLLSGDLVNALQNYKLAFSFLSDNLEQAKATWEHIDISNLPLSLRLAGCIAFKTPFNKILSPTEAGRKDIFFIASSLCSAAGLEYFPDINSSFWKAVSEKNINSVINSHPLDRLLLFAEMNRTIESDHNITNLRRAAYLFPESALGADSYIALSRTAISKREFKLAGFYLKHIDVEKLSPQAKIEFLVAKTEYELLLGDEAAALELYSQLSNAGGSLEPEKELKLALLIQQKGNKHKAQVILEEIWKKHAELKPELQAEILFWIAEGEYAMGQKEKSLKLYLKLAYEYPEQNIWAVTAMYRSSMIYEMKGQYETAKKLLKTVIKRADTKTQKEAAKARMNAIDGKMSKIGPTKSQIFPY
jgi:tetratricopeptide (TPR) repeat protein